MSMFRMVLLILWIISCLWMTQMTFAEPPAVNCFGLPGCVDSDISEPQAPTVPDNKAWKFVGNIITQLIQYVAALAVIALMGSGIMYLVSSGEEEQVNRAKKWIIWSLVGVIFSISAYGIIELVNTFQIT